jgi:hypothetical protein
MIRHNVKQKPKRVVQPIPVEIVEVAPVVEPVEENTLADIEVEADLVMAPLGPILGRRFTEGEIG